MLLSLLTPRMKGINLRKKSMRLMDLMRKRLILRNGMSGMRMVQQIIMNMKTLIWILGVPPFKTRKSMQTMTNSTDILQGYTKAPVISNFFPLLLKSFAFPLRAVHSDSLTCLFSYYLLLSKCCSADLQSNFN